MPFGSLWSSSCFHQCPRALPDASGETCSQVSGRIPLGFLCIVAPSYWLSTSPGPGVPGPHHSAFALLLISRTVARSALSLCAHLKEGLAGSVWSQAHAQGRVSQPSGAWRRGRFPRGHLVSANAGDVEPRQASSGSSGPRRDKFRASLGKWRGWGKGKNRDMGRLMGLSGISGVEGVQGGESRFM